MPSVCAASTALPAPITAPSKKGSEHPDPAISANVIASLIKVTCYLLDQQLKRLEQDFLQIGGLRKRITRARLQIRSQ